MLKKIQHGKYSTFHGKRNKGHDWTVFKNTNIGVL